MPIVIAWDLALGPGTAGWQESAAVFTAALCKLLTSGPASSRSDEADHSSNQHTASRRMLASPSHTSSHTAEGSLLQQATSNQAQQLSMHSMHINVDKPAELPAVTSTQITNQSSAIPFLEGCSATEETTVCKDEHQPAWEVPDWNEDIEAAPANLKVELQQCQLLNSSICAPSVQLSKEGKRFMVVVYNSLAWERPGEPVRVPISMTSNTTTHWLVTGTISPCQVLDRHSKSSSINLNWVMTHCEAVSSGEASLQTVV